MPFDALTLRPKSDYEIVKTEEVQPLLEDEEKSEIILSFLMMRTGDLQSIIWNWIRAASGNQNLI